MKIVATKAKTHFRGRTRVSSGFSSFLFVSLLSFVLSNVASDPAASKKIHAQASSFISDSETIQNRFFAVPIQYYPSIRPRADNASGCFVYLFVYSFTARAKAMLIS